MELSKRLNSLQVLHSKLLSAIKWKCLCYLGLHKKYLDFHVYKNNEQVYKTQVYIGNVMVSIAA